MTMQEPYSAHRKGRWRNECRLRFVENSPRWFLTSGFGEICILRLKHDSTIESVVAKCEGELITQVAVSTCEFYSMYELIYNGKINTMLRTSTTFGSRVDEGYLHANGLYKAIPSLPDTNPENSVLDAGRTFLEPISIITLKYVQRSVTVYRTWLRTVETREIHGLCVKLALKHLMSSKREGWEHIMFLHLLFIEAMTRNWHEYMVHLYEELHKLNQKACLVSLDQNSKLDYCVTFQDYQILQMHRRTLFQAEKILESCSTTIEGIVLHFQEGKFLRMNTHWRAATTRHKKDLKAYKSDIQSLLVWSKDIGVLLTLFLNSRSRGTIEANSHATHENLKRMLQGTYSFMNGLDMLQNIGLRTHYEQQKLGRIAEQARRDSVTLKFLTFVATLYLPASLIASIFSSSLVDIRGIDGADNVSSSRLVVSSQLWVFVVISVGLTVGTFSCARWYSMDDSSNSPRSFNTVASSEVAVICQDDHGPRYLCGPQQQLAQVSLQS
ncbi:hypothetical protein HBH69_056920 [Parastagonospora nodorum]|nr:hypothetical protein HBH69_056920 [Parastagonospora nodorum]KAH5329729.1 hypothetical protein HBI12_068590 [Parastagonospora nodorum]KAH5707330.1 hypothetical protein HBI20_205180 [Parastagonospora nodorum]KAH6244282.1 hypothetical protein HBI42_206280 [Parastagonospora nodorum]